MDMQDLSVEEWRIEYGRRLGGFLKTHYEFLGEEVKAWMLENGLTPPHDPNVWGSVFREYGVRPGFVAKTGRTQEAASAGSRGHSYRVWRSVLCQPSPEGESLGQALTKIQIMLAEQTITLRRALVMAAEVGSQFEASHG